MNPRIILTCLFGMMTIFSNAQKPQISFFNEMEGAPLAKLFKDTSIVPQLQSLHAEIRMGMLDTSLERVAVIKELNKASIPVVAWLLLPKEKGYWFHSKNGDAAINRYHEIRDWAKRNQLHFSGIGLDLELDINDLNLAKEHQVKLVFEVIKRLYDKERVAEGKKIYQGLIDEIRKDGFKVESYYVPFIRYENEKGRTALQQASGFLDIKTDKDIPMLYSSFMGNANGLLNVLAKEEGLKSVAIGSTGGGFDTSLPTMKWKDLEYDLQLSSSFANEIHIFSLEGVVQNNFLSKIARVDFNKQIEKKDAQIKNVQGLKSTVMTLSSILSHPTLLLLGIFALLAFIIWLIIFLLKKIFK